MAPGVRVCRAVGTGTALALLGAYANTGGFTEIDARWERIQAEQNAAWESDAAVSPSRLIALIAAAGGIFGLGYAATTTRLQRRGAVPGAIYGGMIWAASEIAFRLAPRRQRTWLTPPNRGVPSFLLSGALVGTFADRQSH
jgi:hypothetical protein